MGDTVTDGLRDWETLAAWLDAEFKSWDREAHPYHRGLAEAYSTMADLMRDSPPEQREGRLYHLLTRVLTSPTEVEEIEQPS
jgi:hypothetical protein